MSKLVEGRVVAITGGGRGLGRAHALEYAANGAKVVVNDLGGEVDGTGATTGPAQEVVEEIRGMGGEAVANSDDIASDAGARNLVQTAIDHFGRLDVLVNNAGILRDRVLVNMTGDEWDAVMYVHLRGTYAPSKYAASYWRDLVKGGETLDACIVNTSSGAGLFGNPGQTNYGAAKAGIAAFTIIAAKELKRYGVRVNAIGPGARTRMTEPLGFGGEVKEGSFDWAAPENVSPLVCWLGSTEAVGVTGQVFEVIGGKIGVLEGWTRNQEASQKDRFVAADLGPVVKGLLEKANKPEPLFRRG